MIRNVQFTRCKWFTIYQRGFTLLELLIVMVILGLFASIAVIISVNSNQNVKINTAVQDIRASLYSARSQAQSLVSTRCGTNLFTGVQVVFCNAKDKTGTSCLTTQCQNNGSPDYEIDLVCNNSVTATLEEKSIS